MAVFCFFDNDTIQILSSLIKTVQFFFKTYPKLAVNFLNRVGNWQYKTQGLSASFLYTWDKSKIVNDPRFSWLSGIPTCFGLAFPPPQSPSPAKLLSCCTYVRTSKTHQWKKLSQIWSSILLSSNGGEGPFPFLPPPFLSRPNFSRVRIIPA